MSGDDDLVRAGVNVPVDDLAGRKAPGHGPRSAASAGFPDFGALQRPQFEASPHPMRIAEHGTWRYLAVNDAALKLYGYTREEFLKLTLRDTRHPEEHAEQAATFAAHTGCLRHSGVRRHIKKSGETVFVEVITQDVLYNGRPARLSLTVDVTGRLRMQELLWQRQQEFESLAEHLPDLVARYDCEGRFLYVNSALEKALGLERDRIIGRTQRQLGLPAAVAALYDESRAQVFANGEPHRFVFQHPASDGERTFEAHHVAEYGASGAIESMLCVARDITDQERARDELRCQKRLLEAVIDNIPARVFIRDAKTLCYVMRNRFSEEDSGHPIGSSIGKSVYDLYPREFADLLSSTDAEALKTGRLVEVPELRVPGKSGETRIRHVRKMPVFDENGNPWVIVGISNDITERKRVERDLRETNEFLRGVIESSRDCIKVLDFDGRLLWLSAGGQRLMEIDDAAPLLNRNYLDFWSGPDRELACNAIAAAREGKASNFEGYCPTTKGTPKWWDEIVTPIMNAAGQPEKLLVVSRDITAHKRAEEERLAHAVAQRDALVREVHHRIKNSLQGVAGLLRQKIRKYPAIAPGIEEAISQLQSVALVYGLQETRPDGLITLAEILCEVCDSAEGLTGGQVERTHECGTRRPVCVAGSEAVSVAVALNELVFNALKHQAGTGRKRAKVTLLESKDAVEIRVANRGRLPRGFDYPAGRGVGHGLGLVRTLLAAPGGSVAFNGGRNVVEVVLQLRPPLLAGRQRAVAR